MRTFTAAVLAVLVWVNHAGAEAPKAEVPVKQVVLFSSGVGYFEHDGTVHGNDATELRFKSAQINDILKSLVLQDVDGGKVGTVTYPSQDPLAKTLKSFQVDITANPSMADLLNQLRGAGVTITVQAEKITGTILGVEKKRREAGPDKKEIIEEPVLNLVTTNGRLIAQPMEYVSAIELQDPALQDELNRALLAVAQARGQDKKPVTIDFLGQGDRRVRIGYVIETPIWKSSYRLILNPAGAASTRPVAKLQGWAIVENQTDNDWQNIQLSLVSGRPISFVQDLYQPLYIPRPIVQPDLYASLRPQEYAGGMDTDKDRDVAGDAVHFQYRNAQMAANRSLAAEMMESRGAMQKTLAPSASPATPPINAGSSVATIASAAKLGELFEYTVGNVSLPRQKSAMLPIITDDVEAEKVSIYNAGVLPRNPLNGARLKNTTTNHLMAGPVTVLDGGAYAGDARVDDVPPGQDRLLSYGIDLQMLIDSTKNTGSSAVQTARIDKGTLIVTRKNVATQDYVADNKSSEDKTLIIEHPVKPGWKLVDTAKPIETTDSVYRFQQKVPAGNKFTLTVKEESVQSEAIAILPADPGTMEIYQKTGEIPQAVREALAKAAGLKAAIVDSDRQIADRQKRVEEITQEQGRIRENMRTVERNSQYYSRLLTKLNDQESQLEKSQTEIDELQKARKAQQKELEDYLAGLTLG